MAYSNWGAFVTKNRIRRKDREDIGAFDTDESNLPSSMRIFANILKRREQNCNEDYNRSYHAVLGDGPVRLCGYKNHPRLFAIFNNEVEEVELPEPDEEEWETDGHGELIVNSKRYKWQFEQYDGNMIRLKLEEPDGSIWESKCGYCYGAGHMEYYK